jgi:Ca2+-binding RTX toxin-like protein
MATYNGTPGNDSIDIFIPYADPGVVNEKAYAYEGNDSIKIEYEVVYEYGWIEEGGSYSGTVEMHGGGGNDTLSMDNSYEAFWGTPPDISNVVTRLYGEQGNDVFHCWTQEDKYSQYGAGVEYLYGGPGDDTYHVAEPEDEVVERAGEGTDTIVGVYSESFGMVSLPENVENLVLEPMMDRYIFPLSVDATGNALDNRIFGNEIPNALNGGAGNDTIYGKQLGLPRPDSVDTNDEDTIHGGDGNDLIYGAGSGSDTWDGDDTIHGDAGNDTLHGVIGNDAMFGGDGTDVMFGGEGNDTMDGGLGNDDVRGQNGNDTLIGGAGLDRLMGGAGNDTFDYNAVTDSRAGATLRDVITTAFDGVGAAAGDKIDLATIDANSGIGGNQAFAFRGTAAFTGAGQLRVAASGIDTLIQANTGGTLAADMEILVKDGAILPTAWQVGDFIV